MKEWRLVSKGYLQVVVILNGEEIVALQQGDVIVVDLGRPSILFQ